MEYQLTPDDLKEDTEYYIEFEGYYKDFTKCNGTYIFICNKPDKHYKDVVYCTFKNIHNENIDLMYSKHNQKFKQCFNTPYNYYFIYVSITELTSGYVLK